MEHTPLDSQSLSPEAQRAVAPGPARMMAARGLAPISKPADLVSVLYQLSVDVDQGIREAARKSATDLPDKILAPALAEPSLDPRVLDFYATAVVARRPDLLARLVQNPAVADETVASLAAHAESQLVDVIAHNEQRLLRHPAIIAALYKNPHARMSVVDRAVELAIRSDVKVTGIPAWDELVASVMQSGKRSIEAAEPDSEARADAAFERAARAADTEGGEIVEVQEDDEDVPISALSVPQKIRLAMLGNASARGVLIRDPIRMVALAAIKSPGVKDTEALRYAGNNSLHEDVISYIARQREWTKNYQIKSALVKNPKTPLALSIKLIPHLRERDLRQLAKSKNVPTALSAKARKLVATRSGRGG